MSTTTSSGAGIASPSVRGAGRAAATGRARLPRRPRRPVMGDRLDEIRERFTRSEFHTTWLGLRLVRLDAGAADVALDVEPKHRNLMGTLHGGMISTLADTATGVAMGSTLDDDETWTTTSL